eukprot:5236942-Pyramimonas_sp.AAC.2
MGGAFATPPPRLLAALAPVGRNADLPPWSSDAMMTSRRLPLEVSSPFPKPSPAEGAPEGWGLSRGQPWLQRPRTGNGHETQLTGTRAAPPPASRGPAVQSINFE